MAQLAIKGHSTRGEEVIEILEMLGGINTHNLYGDENYAYYTIDSDKEIKTGIYVFGDEELLSLTLEEFFEKYPYKVGDKVNYVKYNDECPSVYTIQRMRWTGVTIEYLLDSSGFSALTKDLQPYKEEETMNKAIFDANAQCCDIMNHLIKKETMEEKLTVQDIKDNNAEWLLNKLQEMSAEGALQVISDLHDELYALQYPKTYEECCYVLNVDVSRTIEHSENYPFYRDITCYEYDLLSRLTYLRKLLICRDTYWKIAGEQMGLDKPWEPNYTDDNIKYNITIHRNELDFNCTIERNYVLIFPTTEMRNEFYENFKYLIEQCKELL